MNRQPKEAKEMIMNTLNVRLELEKCTLYRKENKVYVKENDRQVKLNKFLKKKGLELTEEEVRKIQFYASLYDIPQEVKERYKVEIETDLENFYNNKGVDSCMTGEGYRYNTLVKKLPANNLVGIKVTDKETGELQARALVFISSNDKGIKYRDLNPVEPFVKYTGGYLGIDTKFLSNYKLKNTALMEYVYFNEALYSQELKDSVEKLVCTYFITNYKRKYDYIYIKERGRERENNIGNYIEIKRGKVFPYPKKMLFELRLIDKIDYKNEPIPYLDTPCFGYIGKENIITSYLKSEVVENDEVLYDLQTATSSPILDLYPFF